MPHQTPRPKAVGFIAFGIVTGAFSWSISSLLSGTFEPYDSSTGLLLNQIILAMPVGYISWRYKPMASVLFLLGTYFGMNSYAYIFGGTEAKAWALLGAITSLFLVVAPATVALGAVLLRRLRRSKHQ
ncbi:MAG TPA: hypothetical protein PK702_12045 [Burkholderiaceae bacterium]|jgi:hypothetical protein|uniref:hypothetical protein n=1 Tax=Aquabacterium sp. TaxID=1872578 RepID=UPI001B436490|nr:hypothetical protein [Aquabacterium sp.]MBP7131494.1 hypothetical protein [Aquabacterium sp.]MDQ5927350.1 hypothetical protein [Pseudomonadota bacterium]HRH06543.1 hypothetical protein [Burkholderiaceae bacterium]